MSNSFERQYIQMLGWMYHYGIEVPNERTGTKTKAWFDHKLVISENEFPFSTVRQSPPRLAFEEFWFFLNGRTDTNELVEKGVNFWKGNTSREALDKIGLFEYLEGDLGLAYSKQFRDFGGTGGYGFDQVQNTFEQLKNDPYSRRVYNVIWNPAENHLGCITPCWLSHQFVVLPSETGNVLHLKLTNRSLDVLFGCQYAVMQYRMYQMALAKALGFEVGRMSCDLTHIHIYENQYEYINEVLSRSFDFDEDTYDIGRVTIKKELNTLEDILSMTWDDWDIQYPATNATEFKTPRPEMVA